MTNINSHTIASCLQTSTKTENQNSEMQSNDEENQEVEMETDHPANAKPKTTSERKKSDNKKEHVEWVREPGKSLLPFSRVQKIIKADRVSVKSVIFNRSRSYCL